MNQTAEKPSTSIPMDISIETLYKQWLTLGNESIIIDIRSENDYQSGHIPGSKNIPFASVIERSAELTPFKHIYFYCYGGQGSTNVAKMLSDRGFDNIYYVGQAGLSDWQDNGYPLQS